MVQASEIWRVLKKIVTSRWLLYLLVLPVWQICSAFLHGGMSFVFQPFYSHPWFVNTVCEPVTNLIGEHCPIEPVPHPLEKPQPPEPERGDPELADTHGLDALEAAFIGLGERLKRLTDELDHRRGDGNIPTGPLEPMRDSAIVAKGAAFKAIHSARSADIPELAKAVSTATARVEDYTIAVGLLAQQLANFGITSVSSPPSLVQPAGRQQCEITVMSGGCPVELNGGVVTIRHDQVISLAWTSNPAGACDLSNAEAPSSELSVPGGERATGTELSFPQWIGTKACGGETPAFTLPAPRVFTLQCRYDNGRPSANDRVVVVPTESPFPAPPPCLRVQ
jgi:hypothetical protein